MSRKQDSRSKEIIKFELRAFNRINSLQFFWRMQRTNFVMKHLEEIFNAQTRRNVKVADIGCGPGIVSSFFARKGFNILGVDYCEPFIKFAKKYFKKRNLKGEFSAADVDIESRIFSENHCASIICIDAFEHFRKPDVVLGNFKKLLNNKGYVLLTTPNFGNPLFQIIEWLWDEVAKTPGWREMHITRLNLKIIEKKFQKQGFTIEKSGTFLLFSPFVSIFSRKLARIVSYIENFFLNKIRVGFMIYLIAKLP